MSWLQRLWAHDKTIPVIGAVVAALGVAVAYYSATKPAPPPVVVIPTVSSAGASAVPVIEQTATANGGNAVNATGNAQVEIGDVSPSSASAAAPASLPEQSVKQSASASASKNAVNAAGNAKVKIKKEAGE